ncbi:MAG: TerB family tellurite resistance protein [Sphingomonadales bacterium]
MFNRIKALLGQGGGDAERPGPLSHADKKIAAAALLVEAARMDDRFADDERAAITKLLEGRFDLSREETTSLLAEAEQVQDRSLQLIRFTKTIKDHCSEHERVELVEMLWEVVYADGELHHYEANLLRRVAGLIYVSDRDRGAARKRVLKRMGLAAGGADAS